MTPEEIGIIAANASAKIKLPLEPGALEEIKRFAANGRDAVNMVQLAGGVAFSEGRRTITKADVQWVLSCGQYTPGPRTASARSRRWAWSTDWPCMDPTWVR